MHSDLLSSDFDEELKLGLLRQGGFFLNVWMILTLRGYFA